jgi:lauroyl/myristoyl acyltransferase
MMRDMLQPLLKRVRWDSKFWRQAMLAGVMHGPDALVRYSPPVFGLIFGAALPRQRRVAARTLDRLKGDAPTWRRSLDVASMFATYGSCLAESLLVGSGRGYKPLVHSDTARRHFTQSAALGRGVILASAHTAGWDIAGAKLSAVQAGEVVVVMERERDGQARKLHDRARQAAGVRVVHAGHDPLAALPLLRHLRVDKGVVAMKFDRTAPGMRTRTATFLGEPWQVPEGIFRLAALSGAPILPCFTRRLGFLEYEFVTKEPFHVPRKASDEELDEAAQHLASLLERFARKNPDQWFKFSDDEEMPDPRRQPRR